MGSICNLYKQKRLAIALASASVALSLTACSDFVKRGSNLIPPATTTLQAETGNNTSAADSFVRQTNGNAGNGNVSKLPLRSLLYSGSNTKLYVAWMGWFGRQDHMNVGYNSGDPGEVHRQVMDMMGRGVDGAIAAWYGAGTTSIDNATQLLKTEAESHAGKFEFAIMEDMGALGSAAIANGCDVTDQLISDLTYIESQYESSPAYMRINGRPVVFFFFVDAYYIDWNRVTSSVAGNPLLIFQGPDGLARKLSDGGFSWVLINSNDPFDPGLAAQDSFYQAAQQAPGRLVFGSAYKGFNDTLAPWGTNRLIQQKCGQTWLQTFIEPNKFYSTTSQLPAMQIATWNDYEEGTAIESGIDNCIYLTPSQTGTTINWGVEGGDESTIDHYTVFLSTDGTNLSKLSDVPAGTHTYDLSQFDLPPATYFVYVKATGKPSMQNKMSPAISYHPGDQPPSIQLGLMQTGPLTYTASTAGSSGNIARSQIDFGDGSVVSGPTASHTYGSVGTYLVTASVYSGAGASAVAVQQLSAKPPSGGISILSPANGSTVNWPTMLMASANPGTPAAAMRVLVDGQQEYAAYGDTLNTALKVYTGTHQITVQSLDAAGNVSATGSLNVVAEPGDIPPVADVSIKPLTSISPTTVLGCTAASFDSDGFINSYQLQYSNGSQFSTPAALETLPTPGTYSATAIVMDQFGATNSTSTTFSVGGGIAPAAAPPSPAGQQQQLQKQRATLPMRPPW
jgi:PKD domain-containing protein